MNKCMKFVLATAAGLFLTASSRAAIVITEVNAAGSSSTYGADWFELKNTGGSAVTITNWRIDDDSAAFASGATLTGVTSIPAGGTAVFVDGTSTTSFANFWFAGGIVPPGVQLGTYTTSTIGLSGTSGDQVNIYDNLGALQANVAFGPQSLGATYDNTAGLNNVTLTTLSVVGVNGAFTSVGTPSEVGSVPEPATLGLAAMIGLTTLARRRRA